jgi:CRISPR-associated endonuclease Csn1
LLKDNKSAVKTPLEKLSLDKLEQIVGFGRDTALIDAIRERLLQHGGDGKKAFAANQPPLRKPSKSEEKSPIIRAVKLLSTQKSGIPIRKGIADNDKMLRVDVFSKAGKFHLVPVYVHHRVAKVLPDRAIVASKDEEEWTLIDSSFEFRFSLYPNDLVKIVQKNAPPIWGYYRTCHSGTGNLNVLLHDRNFYGEKTVSRNKSEKGGAVPNDKVGLIEGIGVKTALSLEKFHVDVLGRIYPAKPEPRRGLA